MIELVQPPHTEACHSSAAIALISREHLGVSQNKGSFFGGPDHKDYSPIVFWGLYWCPLFTESIILHQGSDVKILSVFDERISAIPLH